MQVKSSLKKKDFKASFKSADVFNKSKVIRQRVPEFSGSDRKLSMTVGCIVLHLATGRYLSELDQRERNGWQINEYQDIHYLTFSICLGFKNQALAGKMWWNIYFNAEQMYMQEMMVSLNYLSS